jgi:hypothetical protein
MNDKDMARLRAETNYDFGAWVSAVVRQIGHAFRVLNRIQYCGPWDGAAREPASSSRR